MQKEIEAEDLNAPVKAGDEVGMLKIKMAGGGGVQRTAYSKIRHICKVFYDFSCENKRRMAEKLGWSGLIEEKAERACMLFQLFS